MYFDSKTPSSSLDPQRILLVRRDNIGDLVCTTPALAALRARFPGAQIGVLVNSYNVGVLCGNPNIDLVFIYQKLKHVNGAWSKIKAVMGRARVIWELRQWKPEVIILAKSSFDRHGLNFVRLIGPSNVIGFVPNNLDKATALPDIQLTTPDFSALHEVEAIGELLAPLGVDDALGELQVFPDTKTVAAINNKLPYMAKRVALHISAREAERRWGVENFIWLAKYILDLRSDVQILLFWSPGKADDLCHPGDDQMAAQLIQSVKNERLVPLATRDLRELVASLSLCDLFIGTDGGAMHLAVGLGKDVVALFENSPGKLNHWSPWKVAHQIVHSPNPETPSVCNIDRSQLQEALKVFL